MTHDEMIAVIEHHKNGGVVQFRPKVTAPPGWRDSVHPSWNFLNNNYRVKPDPVERWAVDCEDGYVFIYKNKYVAEKVLRDLGIAVRMFRMREVEDDVN